MIEGRRQVIASATLNERVPENQIVIALEAQLVGENFVIIGDFNLPHLTSESNVHNTLEAQLVGENFVIIGDFNLPHLTSESNVHNTKVSTFTCFLNVLNIKQFNRIVNADNKLLDLILSNLNCSIAISRNNCPLVPEDSYHPALNINIEYTSTNRPSRSPNSTKLRVNFRKANFAALYEDLFHADWSFPKDFKDVDFAVNSVYKTLYNTLKKYVPETRANNNKVHYPVWFTTDVKLHLKYKYYYHRKWVKTKKMVFYDEFKRFRSILVENDIKSDASKLWKAQSTRIPGKMIVNDSELNDPSEIVNAFAATFAATFVIQLAKSSLFWKIIIIHCHFPFLQYPKM
ncbi:hypothetical protein QE152_g34006 [Popillia japonica]|uniref:Endonuclease/exonuclease/phosphatase domain-containing protein n=2 Tax=Popillia japonica TaxID=7064 RepID=A0AAW1IVF4_POPJA